MNSATRVNSRSLKKSFAIKNSILFDITDFEIRLEKSMSNIHESVNTCDLHKILVTYFNFAYFFCTSPIRFAKVKEGNGAGEYVVKSFFVQKVTCSINLIAAIIYD